jgi:hypothetical protein
VIKEGSLFPSMEEFKMLLKKILLEASLTFRYRRITLLNLYAIVKEIYVAGE